MRFVAGRQLFFFLAVLTLSVCPGLAVGTRLRSHAGRGRTRSPRTTCATREIRPTSTTEASTRGGRRPDACSLTVCVSAPSANNQPRWAALHNSSVAQVVADDARGPAVRGQQRGRGQHLHRTVQH